MSQVVAIIVTHNPEISILKYNLSILCKETQKVIIVDNNSKNKHDLFKLCRATESYCDIIEIGFNSGVPRALLLGVNYAMKKYSPKWFLFLDDDTKVKSGIIKKILAVYEKLPTEVKNNTAIILLGSFRDKFEVKEVRYGRFSGTLIKSAILTHIRFRVNFFLDQADFDLYSQVRLAKQKILYMSYGLIKHQIGRSIYFVSLGSARDVARKLLKMLIPNYMRMITIEEESPLKFSYEPPWRFYYIVRNSVILLIEKKLDPLTFCLQLMYFGMQILFVDGAIPLLKYLGLGLLHGLIKREGVLLSNEKR